MSDRVTKPIAAGSSSTSSRAAKSSTHNWLPGDKAIVHRNWLMDGFEVRVMAAAEGYAMVRRPHCVPFVEPIRYLYKTKEEDVDDE